MAKKTFKNEMNPALQFISTSTDENMNEKESQAIPDNVPMKRNPLYIETKSKRIQLLIQPSLHSKLKKISERKGTSLNDLIHTILENSTQKPK
jgi:macrodomain Ter protein organizer (MatP/YcbG family)